jgi:hypothetical protein
LNTQNTSAGTKLDLPLEIAHVLLIDVVGYSKLLVNEEIEFLQELNQIVHRMFSGSRNNRQIHPNADRRRDGAAFFSQPRRAGAVCVGD